MKHIFLGLPLLAFLLVGCENIDNKTNIKKENHSSHNHEDDDHSEHNHGSDSEEELADIGYMQEQDIDVVFRGITFGVSIPLWEKKNTIKAAKLNTQALIELEENAREQYVMNIHALQKRAVQLHNIMIELENIIAETRGLELLKKAFDLREITILEYLVEQSMYFELTQKYLETKMNYHSTLAELYKWNY